MKTAEECIAIITEYLSLGGLFNPEAMEHDKVRDLLIDCRESLKQSDRAGWLRAQRELAEIVDNCHLTFTAGDTTVMAEDACPSIRKAILATEYKEPTT